jgi:hypothetical protein
MPPFTTILWLLKPKELSLGRVFRMGRHFPEVAKYFYTAELRG